MAHQSLGRHVVSAHLWADALCYLICGQTRCVISSVADALCLLICGQARCVISSVGRRVVLSHL